MKRIGFLLIDGFAMMSYSSVIEPLRAANLLSDREFYQIKHFSLREVALSSTGAKIDTNNIEKEKDKLDIIFICAGGDPFSFSNKKLLDWIRKKAREGSVLAGVSGGPIILAKAGLDRLELSREISQTFSTAEMVPAAAQGVIGIECLRQKEEIIDIVSKINDFETEVTTNCERSVNSALFADCHSPIGSYATYANGKCRLESIVISPDGSVEARDTVTGSANNAEELGLELADRLKQIGAIEILKLAR